MDLPQRQDVAAVAHGDGQADARPTIDAEDRLRRIDKDAPDSGNIAQAQQPAVRGDIERQKVAFGFEGPGDAKQDRLIAGVQRAGGTDRILRLDCRDQRGAIDAEPCEFLCGKLDNDAFILSTENLDLGDVGYPQEPRADFLDIIAKLAMGETVRREAVDDPEGVAELVVKAGTDDTGRQGAADVADVLADVIPDVRHVLGRRAAF